MPSQQEHDSGPVLAEFDMVKTRVAISIDGRILPSGSLGAIVLIHRDGRAFEVEFAEPVPAVVTLEVGEIAAAA